ncbi:unnamed protein product, partial [Rotaria sp. Silwood2]
VNLIFYDLQAKECKNWIQRVEDELLKQLDQIRKGYESGPWLMRHPY